MLEKLLRQNLSIPQLVGYFVTALIGMSIIFTAFGFSLDIKPIFSPNTGLLKNEYIVVTKKVSMLSAINSKNTIFSEKEIEEIKSQNFIKSISFFTPCKYGVYAYMEASANVPYFATEMFFESVPDRLLDVAADKWSWHEGDTFIPVIVPRDYLTLYNFGFAGSKNLPQISEELIKEVNFNVMISNEQKKERYKSRIVGFSDYLNTILVPETFMEWANNAFGDGAPTKKSKLLVEVANLAAPETAEFFASKNYEINKNGDEQSKLSYILKLIIIAVSIVGLLILLPATGLMFLSINLLVYKNRKTLGNLILMGYSRRELARPYSILVLGLNLLTGLASFGIFELAREFYLSKLQILRLEKISVNILAVLFVIMCVSIVTFVNIVWIRQKMEKIAPPVRG
ncbi:MAG: ABC transporter permease [Prevotellaceae bacterium]|jgi:hypothetical protein|nr:ABC transporter permease [Prevotellaceae bacterium]